MIQYYKNKFHPNSKIWPLDTNLCVGVSVAYLPKAFIRWYYHGVSVFRRKLKDQICNAQNRRSGEMANRLFETYTNTFMPHGKHMCKTSSDMDMATMCTYPSSKYALPHYKCVLSDFAQC